MAMTHTCRAAVGALLAVSLLGLILIVAPATDSSAATPNSPSTSHKPSGSITVSLTDVEWPGLDPATNVQDTADAAMMNAIFGGLFEFGPRGQVIPDEATKYRVINNGKTFEIFLRRNLKFSDGKPMTAKSVAQNIARDLLPANACTCDPDFASVVSVRASGPTTVVMALSSPFPPLIYSFDDTAPNWTVDLAARAAKGSAAFSQHPIGAGPFSIVHNEASDVLALEANPDYWEPGRPLIKNLTFQAFGADTNAYQDLRAGRDQVADGITTISVVQQAEQQRSLKVIELPATGYNFVEMNASVPPFNKILAREAIYYATDSGSLVRNLYANFYKVVESPTAPGETIYLPQVQNYRTYDLTKARALVRQLGGLTLSLGTSTNTQYWQTEVSALSSQWKAAGITVHLVINSLQSYEQDLSSNNWQALDTNSAGYDPGTTLPSHFSSKSPMSGVRDLVVDRLMNQGAATIKYPNRVQIYKRLAEQMNENADVVFLYSTPVVDITAKSVQGISPLDSDVSWENVK